MKLILTIIAVLLILLACSCKKDEALKIVKDESEHWTDVRKNNMTDSLTKYSNE